MEIVRVSRVPIVEKEGYSVKELLAKILSSKIDNVGVYETTIKKGSVCGYHYHENLDEVVIFLNKCKMKVEEKIYELGAGDLVIFRPGDKHEFISEYEDSKLIAIKLPNLRRDRISVGEN